MIGDKVKTVNYDRDPDEIIKELNDRINFLTQKLINR
jgi:hypothetical protein